RPACTEAVRWRCPSARVLVLLQRDQGGASPLDTLKEGRTNGPRGTVRLQAWASDDTDVVSACHEPTGYGQNGRDVPTPLKHCHEALCRPPISQHCHVNSDLLSSNSRKGKNPSNHYALPVG